MPLALRTASLAALIGLALLLGAMARGPALAAVEIGLRYDAAAELVSEDEVRATFERFVAAQNAHDEKALAGLLLDAPDFLWITRGTAVSCIGRSGSAVHRSERDCSRRRRRELAGGQAAPLPDRPY